MPTNKRMKYDENATVKEETTDTIDCEESTETIGYVNISIAEAIKDAIMRKVFRRKNTQSMSCTEENTELETTNQAKKEEPSVIKKKEPEKICEKKVENTEDLGNRKPNFLSQNSQRSATSTQRSNGSTSLNTNSVITTKNQETDSDCVNIIDANPPVNISQATIDPLEMKKVHSRILRLEKDNDTLKLKNRAMLKEINDLKAQIKRLETDKIFTIEKSMDGLKLDMVRLRNRMIELGEKRPQRNVGSSISMSLPNKLNTKPSSTPKPENLEMKQLNNAQNSLSQTQPAYSQQEPKHQEKSQLPLPVEARDAKIETNSISEEPEQKARTPRATIPKILLKPHASKEITVDDTLSGFISEDRDAVSYVSKKNVSKRLSVNIENAQPKNETGAKVTLENIEIAAKLDLEEKKEVEVPKISGYNTEVKTEIPSVSQKKDEPSVTSETRKSSRDILNDFFSSKDEKLQSFERPDPRRKVVMSKNKKTWPGDSDIRDYVVNESLQKIKDVKKETNKASGVKKTDGSDNFYKPGDLEITEKLKEFTTGFKNDEDSNSSILFLSSSTD